VSGNNDHFVGLLRAVDATTFDLPAASWSRLRENIASDSFTVREASHAGVAAMLKWVLATVACHDIQVGKALAASYEEQAGALSAEEAERRAEERSAAARTRQQCASELAAAATLLARAADELRQSLEAELTAAGKTNLDASQALSCLKKSDIVELKSLKSPPRLVKITFEALAILFGAKPTWDGALALLTGTTFLHQLLNLDPAHIPRERAALLRAEYLNSPEFAPDAVATTSAACRGLCEWVHATVALHELSTRLAAPRSELAEARAALAAARALLPPELAVGVDETASYAEPRDHSLSEEVDDGASDAGSEWSRTSRVWSHLSSRVAPSGAISHATRRGGQGVPQPTAEWSHLSRDSAWRTGGAAADGDDDTCSVASDWSEASAAAFEALSTVSSRDVSEVKAFAKPPHLVKLVIESVCLTLGVDLGRTRQCDH